MAAVGAERIGAEAGLDWGRREASSGGLTGQRRNAGGEQSPPEEEVGPVGAGEEWIAAENYCECLLQEACLRLWRLLVVVVLLLQR